MSFRRIRTFEAHESLFFINTHFNYQICVSFLSFTDKMCNWVVFVGVCVYNLPSLHSVCVYYCIKFIFNLSNFCVKLSGALVLTAFVVGGVLYCLWNEYQTGQMHKALATLLNLWIWHSLFLYSTVRLMWMRWFCRLTLSDLLVSLISVLLFFSNETSFFFLTQKVDCYLSWGIYGIYFGSFKFFRKIAIP